jgi:hypothetical protein
MSSISRLFESADASASRRPRTDEVVIFFDASKVLKPEFTVELYSRIEPSALILQLMDWDFFTTYTYHGESKLFELCDKKDFPHCEIAIIVASKNMFEEHAKKKLVITDVLSDVPNCDAVNISNMISRYLPVQSIASVYLPKHECDTYLVTYCWALETRYKNEDGEEMVRYDYEEDKDCDTEMKILLNNFDFAEILSVFLVYKDYMDFDKVIWRSEKPLNIDFEYALKEKSRVFDLLQVLQKM